MEQMKLTLLGRMDGPSVAPMHVVTLPRTYREAVRLAWGLRRVPRMTKQQLAAEADLYPQHISDYLAGDDKPGRRDLPADGIPGFECVVGNTVVSQWLARQSHLTVLEEMQATTRVAA